MLTKILQILCNEKESKIYIIIFDEEQAGGLQKMMRLYKFMQWFIVILL